MTERATAIVGGTVVPIESMPIDSVPIEGGTVACHAIEEGRLAVEERNFGAPTDQRA